MSMYQWFEEREQERRESLIDVLRGRMTRWIDGSWPIQASLRSKPLQIMQAEQYLNMLARMDPAERTVQDNEILKGLYGKQQEWGRYSTFPRATFEQASRESIWEDTTPAPPGERETVTRGIAGLGGVGTAPTPPPPVPPRPGLPSVLEEPSAPPAPAAPAPIVRIPGSEEEKEAVAETTAPASPGVLVGAATSNAAKPQTLEEMALDALAKPQYDAPSDAFKMAEYAVPSMASIIGGPVAGAVAGVGMNLLAGAIAGRASEPERPPSLYSEMMPVLESARSATATQARTRAESLMGAVEGVSPAALATVAQGVQAGASQADLQADAALAERLVTLKDADQMRDWQYRQAVTDWENEQKRQRAEMITGAWNQALAGIAGGLETRDATKRANVNIQNQQTMMDWLAHLYGAAPQVSQMATPQAPAAPAGPAFDRSFHTGYSPLYDFNTGYSPWKLDPKEESGYTGIDWPDWWIR